MLNTAFGNRIAVVDRAQDWKDAIRLSVEPLIADGLAESRYLDGIYNNLAQNGDYIIIAPGVAIPHTRPENGARGTGFSMIKLNKAVTFSEGEDVELLVALVASGSDEHVDLLAELSELFLDDDLMERIKNAKTTQALKEILK